MCITNVVVGGVACVVVGEPIREIWWPVGELDVRMSLSFMVWVVLGVPCRYFVRAGGEDEEDQQKEAGDSTGECR